MAKTFEYNGMTYASNFDIDVTAIIDKIKRAAAGENVPGVMLFNLPSNTIPKAETQEAGTSLSIMTMLLLGALAFVILKPKRK